MALEEKKSQEKLMNVVSQVAGKQISSQLGVDKFLQDFAKKATPKQEVKKEDKKAAVNVPKAGEAGDVGTLIKSGVLAMKLDPASFEVPAKEPPAYT